MSAPAPLTEEVVAPLLRGRFGAPWLWRDECASTQDLLRGTGLPEGAVAVTEHQTAGRGRAGRTWEDRPGSSLLVSVLLRPLVTRALPQLSLVVGLALAETIETLTGLGAMVKWPNDVLLDGRKTAGILLEGDGNAVVCGIGVNVRQAAEELPRDTRFPATSLALAAGEAPDRAALLAELLLRLEQRYDVWCADGLGPLLPEVERRNALAGTAARAGATTGVVGAIVSDGRIALVDAAGASHLVVSGELEPL